MKEVKIYVSDKFKIPSVCKNMSPEEWEITINYISEFLTKHDIKMLENSEESIREQISEEYADQLTQLTEQVEKYEEKLSEITDEYSEMLANQRQELEARHKLLLEESIKSQISARDVLIESLKDQNKDMQQQIATISKLNKNKLQPVQEELDLTRKQLDDLKRNLSNQIEQERESITTQYAEHIEQLKKQQTEQFNTMYKQHSVDLKNLHEANQQMVCMLNAEHQTELNKIKQEHLEKQTEIIMSKLQELDPLFKVFGGSSSSTNNDKGEGGEFYIQNVLTECKTYSDSRITDVSGQTASGDIIFEWKGMKCLIEVKNKKTITTEDVSKFVRDVSAQQDKINCAMFISLRSGNIPQKTRELIQVEYITGMPVIYAYVKPPGYDIYYVISCLEKIFNSSLDKSNRTEQLIQYFIDYYNQILTYQQYFERELKKKQKEIKELLKHTGYFQQLSEQLAPSYSKLSKIDLSNQENENQEYQEDHENNDYENADESESEFSDESEFKEKPKELLDEDEDIQLNQLVEKYIYLSLKQDTPTLEKLNSFFTTKTKIPFKTISAAAKLHYMQTQIQDSHVQKITDFYEKNQRYPNRKELLEYKILADHILRNISKVTKQKKPADYIAAYVSNL